MHLTRQLAVVALVLLAASSYAGPPPATGLQEHLTFTEPHPLSAPNIVASRLGLSGQRNTADVAGRYHLADETFTVFVPANYSPRTPPGRALSDAPYHPPRN